MGKMVNFELGHEKKKKEKFYSSSHNVGKRKHVSPARMKYQSLGFCAPNSTTEL